MAGLLNASRRYRLICRLKGPETWEVYHARERGYDWHDIVIRLLSATASRRSWWLSYNTHQRRLAQRPDNDDLARRYSSFFNTLEQRLAVWEPPQP